MEILEFSASAYIAIARILTSLDHNFKQIKVAKVLPETAARSLCEALAKIRGYCELIGLTMSIKSVDRLAEELKNKSEAKVSDARAALAEINQRINDEIEDNLFLYIPKTQAEWYKRENLFGNEVAQSFPSTAYDIKEAGKCLALNRNTAAVFHLNRVIEVGLRAIGKTLNVMHLDPCRNPTWEAILGKCDAELKKQRPDRSSDWQSSPEFFAEATARLRSVKEAWRNPTMHVEKKYTSEEAQDIYNAVRAFMRYLATKLKETA